LFDRLSEDGLVIEDEMSLDAGIVSASFDASLEMVLRVFHFNMFYFKFSSFASFQSFSGYRGYNWWYAVVYKLD
jgi:hypothetical protein